MLTAQSLLIIYIFIVTKIIIFYIFYIWFEILC